MTSQSLDLDARLTCSSSQQQNADMNFEDPLQNMANMGRLVWSQISQSDNFKKKYGRDLDNPGAVHCYLFTRQHRIDTFTFEAFASVRSASIMKEELVFHPLFEQLIERYTRTQAKPNQVLLETRSTDFCYRLTILVEAVPVERVQQSRLRLVREFAVLNHVWEQFRLELVAKQMPADFLVGVPMPFEFVNVEGNPDYDIQSLHGLWLPDLRGVEVPLSKFEVPGSSSNSNLRSSLNYLSIEKVGPTIHYLTELLKSQRRAMNLSTALKIFDQLLSRLMVLHKFGVILGSLDSRFLNFGVREASKVLYINRYDFAVVAPTQHRSMGSFSERCASLAALRLREVHFVNDIEAAFYVFLSMIFPTLPWDSGKFVDSSSENSNFTASSGNHSSMHLEEKANFWSGSTVFQRMLRHVTYEFPDLVYQGFTVDLLSMLYGKTLEVMTKCAVIPHAEYMSLILTQSSPANNAYSSLRRIIATYFQFESLSGITQDPLCRRKVELLLIEDPEDRRVLWNLNDWCWNPFYPAYVSKTRTKSSSMIL